MLEYSSFCYLQNHKTGSTFVEEYLRKYSREAVLRYEKHATLDTYDPKKFYFTNVREPLSLYRSLYSYGLDGKGTVFLRLQRLGYGNLYENEAEGFDIWLRFVLDSRNARLLTRGYGNTIASLIGLMTWRFLRLACPGFESNAREFRSRSDIKEYIKTHYILGGVLRQENLRSGLIKLTEGPLSHALEPVPEALDWLRQAPKVNTSRASSKHVLGDISQETFQLLRKKESFLYQSFYPKAAIRSGA